MDKDFFVNAALVKNQNQQIMESGTFCIFRVGK